MEKQNKKPRKIDNKQLSFFGGIALCLISVILIMNVGVIARVFAFPLMYLFGLDSYLIYLFIYILGTSFLFREKGIKIRFRHLFWGFVLLFIAATIISTLLLPKCINTVKYEGNPVVSASILNTSTVLKADNTGYEKINFATAFNTWCFNSFSNNGDAKSYFNMPFINMFSAYPLGGGILGYAIVGGLNSLTGGKLAISWVVGIMFIVLGLVTLFYPVIKKAINKNKPVKEIKKVENIQNNEENEPVSASLSRDNAVETTSQTNSGNKYNNARVSNIDVLSSAGDVDPNYRGEVNSLPSSASTQNIPASFNKTSQPNASINNPNQPVNFSNSSNYFVPAKFVRFPNQQVQPMVQPVQPQVNKPKPQAVDPVQVLLKANAETTKMEQMQLNFDEKPELNQELIMAQPEYEQSKESNNLGTIKPAEPVIKQVEQPVVKKPIKWIPPSTELLQNYEASEAIEKNNLVAEERKQMINELFADFKNGAECIDYVVGPSVTRYNIKYQNAVSVKSVNNLEQDISVRLGGVGARFQAVVEGQKYSGIEIPNAMIATVSFKEVFESLPDVKKHPLAVGFGKTIDGKVVARDLNEFPHALISGTTGSGKSIFVHSIITTLIMRNSPDNLRLVLIDPKKVEMVKYRDLAHLLCPVISDPSQAKVAMSKLQEEMERRYSVFEENPDGATNIEQYNEYAEENGIEKMPYIVVVIDEYADLVNTNKEISGPVVAIAQKARAAGIHMLIATQRPSTDVITGVIKGNLPTRVALAVASQVDSVTILNEGGAEKLLGKGDMLASSPIISRVGPVRMQGCFISNKEIMHVIAYIKEHYPVNYDPNFLDLHDRSAEEGAEMVSGPEFQAGVDAGEEAKYQSIKEWVMSNAYMSMSRIQRECGVGFNRAGRFFKRLQDEGVVAEQPEGNKGCPVLVNDKFYEGSVDTDLPTSDEVTK